LANLGLGQRGAVLMLYLLGAVSGTAAIWVSHRSATSALSLAAFIVLSMLLAVAILEKAPYERQTLKP
jgi:hypothetical protein